MKKYFAVVIFALTSISVYSQKYNTVGGIRIADDFGISFSQRIANKNTVQLSHQPGTFGGDNMTVALVNQHYPLLSKRLNFFMGAGLYTRSIPSPYVDQPDLGRSNGLAFNLGAEFSIGRLSISTDYIPLVTLNKNDSNKRFYTSSGVSLRYIIVPRKSKTSQWLMNIFKKKKK